MPRKPVMLIHSPHDWAKILSPVRFQAMEVIRSIGPCSISQIAAQMHRPMDALYRHIHILQQLGIVLHAGFRKTERQAEELFDLAADDIRIGFDEKSRRGVRNALAGTAHTVFHNAERGLIAAAEADELSTAEPGRNFQLSYDLTWLTPEAFAKASEHFRLLLKILDEGRIRKQGRLYASAFTLFPVVSSTPPRPRSHARKSSNSTTSPSPRRPTSSVKRRPPSKEHST